MDICRICLTESVERDVTQLPKELGSDTKTYWDIMLFCLSVQISPESKLSTKLCIKCFIKIISFYKFKSLALKSDAYLRSLQNKEDNNYEAYEMDNIKCEEISNGHTDDMITDSEIKEELIKKENNVEEVQSDDELLSVIKKIKYEFIPEEIKEKKTNHVKKKVKSITKVRKRNREMERREKVCDECGKTVINLKEHMALHQPLGIRKRYKCKACDKLFSSYSARYKHHKIKHLGIKQHCDECGKDVVSLHNHRQVMHNTQNLPFECVPCGRRFISKSKMDLHMQIHTKDRPYPCKQCDKTFRNKFGLLQHIRQVHEKEKPHLCQFCSKRFFKKYHLQVHLRSHSKEKPYECPDCGKYYSSCTVLKNHRLIHSEVKMFSCNLCDMRFKKPGYLRNHMISHTKEKRYSCQYCGVLFGRSDHRLRHQRTAHERLLPAAE